MVFPFYSLFYIKFASPYTDEFKKKGKVSIGLLLRCSGYITIPSVLFKTSTYSYLH